MSNENYDKKALEEMSARLAVVEKAIGADKLEEVKSSMSEDDPKAIAGGWESYTPSEPYSGPM